MFIIIVIITMLQPLSNHCVIIIKLLYYHLNNRCDNHCVMVPTFTVWAIQ